MKTVLLCLLFCLSVNVNAEMTGESVIHSFKRALVSEETKSSEKLFQILENYINDGCRVIVNGESVVLCKDQFEQYSNIGATVFPKVNKDYSLKIKEENIVNNGDSKQFHIKASLELDKDIDIDFIVENNKFSLIEVKDVPLGFKQKLMLKGCFNLLNNISSQQI